LGWLKRKWDKVKTHFAGTVLNFSAENKERLMECQKAGKLFMVD
jgi:hypothetical protein